MFEKESTELNRSLVEGKNVSVELVRKGMAELVIYQVQLLEAQEEAKKQKLGIWKTPQS